GPPADLREHRDEALPRGGLHRDGRETGRRAADCSAGIRPGCGTEDARRRGQEPAAAKRGGVRPERGQEGRAGLVARVYNWQIGREMSYWYPEARPKRQFAAVFDVNKCIACQTCTLACKTTWTSGKGQEYMLWNNVETKPWGFYPLGWDVKL